MVGEKDGDWVGLNDGLLVGETDVLVVTPRDELTATPSRDVLVVSPIDMTELSVLTPKDVLTVTFDRASLGRSINRDVLKIAEGGMVVLTAVVLLPIDVLAVTIRDELTATPIDVLVVSPIDMAELSFWGDNVVKGKGALVGCLVGGLVAGGKETPGWGWCGSKLSSPFDAV